MKAKHLHSWRVKGSVDEAGVRRFTLECACGKSKTKTKKVQKLTTTISSTFSSSRRKRINPVSKKRKELNQEYSKLRVTFLEAHPRCAVFPHLPSDQIHHVRGREGKWLLDTNFWLAVSMQGHEWIHQNPAKAKELGYMELRK